MVRPGESLREPGPESAGERCGEGRARRAQALERKPRKETRAANAPWRSTHRESLRRREMRDMAGKKTKCAHCGKEIQVVYLTCALCGEPLCDDCSEGNCPDAL